MHWPRNPLLYQINTWVWLEEISQRYGQRIDLSTVPAEYWKSIAELGFDAVWLMGVWERSPESIRISLADHTLLASFHHALPDFTPRTTWALPIVFAVM